MYGSSNLMALMISNNAVSSTHMTVVIGGFY
jgi:hypothetical protein